MMDSQPEATKSGGKCWILSSAATTSAFVCRFIETGDIVLPKRSSIAVHCRPAVDLEKDHVTTGGLQIRGSRRNNLIEVVESRTTGGTTQDDWRARSLRTLAVSHDLKGLYLEFCSNEVITFWPLEN